LIITGGPHAGHFLRVLKNGKELGIKHLEFAYQENEGGIADALSLAEDFSDEEPVCVILGDNCTDVSIKKSVEEFKDGATIFLKEVSDPERFGVPVFDEKDNIVKIEEKPKKPKSKYAVTGLYIYDATVFNKIRQLERSARGELEVTDLNNSYIKESKMKWAKLDGFWSDAGTFDSLNFVSSFWAKKKK
jgi:glucose-1-phosphate thymidylyltransferase